MHNFTGDRYKKKMFPSNVKQKNICYNNYATIKFHISLHAGGIPFLNINKKSFFEWE
jgi:hypothetical protein